MPRTNPNPPTAGNLANRAELKARIILLHALGNSQVKIAKLTGVSPRTVKRIILADMIDKEKSMKERKERQGGFDPVNPRSGSSTPMRMLPVDLPDEDIEPIPGATNGTRPPRKPQKGFFTPWVFAVIVVILIIFAAVIVFPE